MANDSKYERSLKRAFNRYGEEVKIMIGTRRWTVKGFMQDMNRKFINKFFDDHDIKHFDLGDIDTRLQVGFFPYSDVWEIDDSDIFVEWRGKLYRVEADSFITFKGVPFYIWAVIREVVDQGDNYFDYVGHEFEKECVVNDGR